MSQPKPTEDQFVPRQYPRMQTFSFVMIYGEDGTPLMEATIREISTKGAHLRLSNTADLPDCFIIRSVQDQSQKLATLKWQSGASIGVEFDDQF